MYAISGLEPDTVAGRVLVVVVGAVALLVMLGLAHRLFTPPFFRGFIAAAGVIFSFDVVVFHWLFGLHRVTEGSEANVIEPVMVAIGVGFVTYGLTRARSQL